MTINDWAQDCAELGNMKYELTEETQIVKGATLYRIRALKDFGLIKAGDLGGWVASYENLSQSGDAWVTDNAIVTDNARVSDDAIVTGNARVTGNAWVKLRPNKQRYLEKEDNMVKWIDKIHEAIGGDYTDDCPIIEEAARELAMRLEWYHNKQTYIDAYNRQIKALAAIEGTEELREAITDKINNGHPYNIMAIQEIIDRGYVD